MGCLKLTYRPKKSSPLKVSWNRNEAKNPCKGVENYLYNGKELQQETEWYDYGARMYDPQLGRFFTQDRFAEKYLDFSPYQYAANNPILYIDVNGDSISVAEQYREQFQADLQATFGDKASSFSFNEIVLTIDFKI